MGWGAYGEGASPWDLGKPSPAFKPSRVGDTVEPGHLSQAGSGGPSSQGWALCTSLLHHCVSMSSLRAAPYIQDTVGLQHSRSEPSLLGSSKHHPQPPPATKSLILSYPLAHILQKGNPIAPFLFFLILNF